MLAISEETAGNNGRLSPAGPATLDMPSRIGLCSLSASVYLGCGLCASITKVVSFLIYHGPLSRILTFLHLLRKVSTSTQALPVDLLLVSLTRVALKEYVEGCMFTWERQYCGYLIPVLWLEAA